MALETPCPDSSSETGIAGIAKGLLFNVGQIQSQQSQQPALHLITLTAFSSVSPSTLENTCNVHAISLAHQNTEQL